MEFEPTPTSSSLPIISDEVRDCLMADLGLDVDDASRRIVAGITGESPEDPRLRASALVESVFNDIRVTNPNFVLGTLDVLKGIKNYWDFRIDGFTIGMATVISAFDKMSNWSLTDRFDRLNQEDVEEALKIIRDTASSGIKGSILERVISGPRIPNHQINLNQFITKLIKSTSLIPQATTMRAGAGAMYKILSIN